ACGGQPGCFGWQQFIFSNSQCGGGVGCIFMQYWLVNHKSPCPAGWTFFGGSPTSASGCYRNSANTAPVSAQPIANLSQLRLTGTANASGNDTVVMTTPSGVASAASPGSVVNLGSFWTGAEFNLVGDCCSSQAFFNAGSSMKVRLTLANGTSNAPTC